MTTALDKVLREYATTEAGLTLAAGQWGQAQDTGRIKAMRRDGVTFDWVETASRLAGQTTVLGLALIGMSGITGITPNGGTSGAAATAANMLIGMRDSVILKSPYNSTINTIQPTADYVPLNIKGFASGVSNLLTLQTSATTVAWFDASANLTLSRSDAGNNVSLRAINSNNSNTTSNALAVLSVGGGSAGDPYINFNINGVTDWAIGVDNSVSGDPFKFSNSNTLGTTDFFILDPSNHLAQLTSNVNNSLTFQIYNQNSGSLNYASLNIVSTSATGNSYILLQGASHSWALGQNANASDQFSISLGGNLGTGDALKINTALTVTVPNALTVTGIASHAAAITFNGNGTTATGSILKTAADGLLLRGITGSSNDFGLYNNGGTLILSNPTGTNNISLPGGDLTLSRSNVGGFVLSTIANGDNTSTSSHASLLLKVQGSSGGNPYIQFNVNGATSWSAGIDNNDSDKFKIGVAATLGTSTALIIDTSQNITTGANLICGGGNGSYFQFPISNTTPSGAEARTYWDSVGKHLFIHNGTAYVQIV